VVNSDVPKRKGDMPKERKNVMFDPALYENLRRLAYWRRKSMSEILDRLVRTEIQNASSEDLSPIPDES
jgi:hypothetical protein